MLTHEIFGRRHLLFFLFLVVSLVGVLVLCLCAEGLELTPRFMLALASRARSVGQLS
jgi:hypothetical protein